MISEPEVDWQAAQIRYAGGESRSTIFRDLVLAEVNSRRRSGPVSVLDIGCGMGFDYQPELQLQIAQACDRYIGIEPDMTIPIQPVFSECYRSTLEAADIPPGSIDVAFSVMVLEHVGDPALHWQAVHSALKDGGVYWGLTMDSRHWFAAASKLADTLRIKELYLTALRGRRGKSRYENYPTYYRANSPAQIVRSTHLFRAMETFSFYRPGQADYYFPTTLRWVGRTLDRLAFAANPVGLILAVKAVRDSGG